MNHPEYIVVHTTATPPKWMAKEPATAKVAEIDRWHKDRGFKGFGYHWLIDRDGTLAAGRKETETGAHTIGYNDRSIGITLVGGLSSNENDDFYDNYTVEQHSTLDKVLHDLMRDYKLPVSRVIGHNQVAPKACPGFMVPLYMEKYYGKNHSSPQVWEEGTSNSNASRPAIANRIMGWAGQLFGR
jgi:hypothetical protein